MALNDLKQKVTGIVDNVKYNWKEPPKGRYMTFKEIFSYAFGGIGAYFLITMGTNLAVNTTNMIVGGAIGVAPTDMYILYLIATLANIPLTAVRANMIDNTRGKGGKYRPYLLSMGIPTAIIALGYVYFPYEKLEIILGTGKLFGHAKDYIFTCAIVLVFNLLLQFFFNFFQDAYTNLIHVLSPNTQERTDVLSIKAVVYSLAPSIVSFVNPIIAQLFTNNNLYDIKVYRITYPVFAILGILLTIVVFANTQEKIVQAKTHTIQIRFMDSLKEVAKNKYFWIISLAGWLGFLEGAYGNILQWSYNYGHSTNGTVFSIINLITSNASMWGMILAPFCIRKFGKKKVLLGINTLNIVFILAMMIDLRNIWWLAFCVYLNWFVGAFEQITNPSIQADIRDYQQYKTGERIDGMFAAVLTIGNIITLLTSSVLPAVQKHYGVYEGNGYASPFDILDVNTGQDGLLYKLMGALVLMAALGAVMNMIPFFFYDLTEKKQKSIVRVLQIRSLFEDYANNALNNHQIVEAIDMVNNAREMAVASPKDVSKASYKGISDKAEKKAAKKAYKEALNFNEEIDIAKFVCAEIDKFQSDLYIHESAVNEEIFAQGLEGIKNIDIESARMELRNAKNLPKNTEDEKEFRNFEIETAKKKISAKKAFNKYYGTLNEFVSPSMEALTDLFNQEDACDEKIFELVEKQKIAKNENEKDEVKAIKTQVKEITKEKKEIQKKSKTLMDEFAKFNRAAKPYNDAKKFLVQQENFSHFDEIAALYDEAKAKAQEEDKIKEEKAAQKRAEVEAELAARKAKKAAKKNK
ncbi:MAG: MFS transporter [Acetobacter sp.]|nr:MFS transporter [Bacteroides sp.]MCM1341348.1 MFS transporter [Acetobacter sp.]MCM1433440.1 MFS transporter [Clostridiales bacterium]